MNKNCRCRPTHTLCLLPEACHLNRLHSNSTAFVKYNGSHKLKWAVQDGKAERTAEGVHKIEVPLRNLCPRQVPYPSRLPASSFAITHSDSKRQQDTGQDSAQGWEGIWGGGRGGGRRHVGRCRAESAIPDSAPRAQCRGRRGGGGGKVRQLLTCSCAIMSSFSIWYCNFLSIGLIFSRYARSSSRRAITGWSLTGRPSAFSSR